MIDIFGFLLHVDSYLYALVEQYGVWIYSILFLIIFAETGLVIAPFLPGDSLLFAVGAISAANYLNPILTYVLMLVAAIIGDAVNYWIGHRVGEKAFTINSKLFKAEYLHKAQKFYEKHGAKSIVLARFFPIVRTFAPFAAGIAKMDYKNFAIYNVLGAFLWVTIFFWLGYFMGNIPIISANFHYLTVLIIVVSFIPLVVEFIKYRKGEL